MRRFFLIFVISIFFYSCSTDCFKKSGKIVKKEFFLEDFTQLTIFDDLDVIIKQDTINKVILEGGKNLIDNVKFEFDAQGLKISNKSVCSWVRGFKDEFKLVLYAKELEKLTYEGYGKITSYDTLFFDKFHLVSWGGGGVIDLKIKANQCWIYSRSGCTDIILEGKVKTCYMMQREASKIQSYNLLINNLEIKNDGLNDCFINVKEIINFKLSNKGNIYCKGNSKVIHQETTGSGKFIRIK